MSDAKVIDIKTRAEKTDLPVYAVDCQGESPNAAHEKRLEAAAALHKMADDLVNDFGPHFAWKCLSQEALRVKP
jgi:hypothetical protein